MKTNGNSNGFSMIEVLVASAILTVIVMMLAMLFQQTSLAWRTGVKRADGFMQVRSAIGAIQRDASAAVDANGLPDDLKSKVGGGNQQFSGGSLRFYTLTGATPAGPNRDLLRTLSLITYDTSGKRTETILKADGSREVKTSNVLDFANRASSKNRPIVSVSSFQPEYGDAGSAALPLFVKIEANVTMSGYSLDIGAASAGPDKVWGTPDDIRTWVED